MLQSDRAFSSFSVDDVEKAKAFYGDTLGLAVQEAYGGLTIPVANGGTVMLFPKDDHTPATYTVLNF